MQAESTKGGNKTSKLNDDALHNHECPTDPVIMSCISLVQAFRKEGEVVAV